MITHVLGKASQRESGLRVDFGIVLTVPRVAGILVLAQVDAQLNFVCCHNCVFLLNVFCGIITIAKIQKNCQTTKLFPDFIWLIINYFVNLQAKLINLLRYY